MTDEKQFPVLMPMTMEKPYASAGIPAFVPWHLVAPHEARAQRNHGQTLTRLAERGGLSPGELVSLLEDKPLNFRLDNDAAGLALKLKSLGVCLRDGGDSRDASKRV